MSISFRDLFGPGEIDIDHARQFHAFHLGIFLGMELPQVPDPDHPDPCLLHLTTDPPLRLGDELKEMLDL